MDFNSNHKLSITVRVIAIIVTGLLLINSFYNDSYLVTKGILITAMVYQVLALVKILDKSNEELISFLDSIKYDDFTHTYNTKKTDSHLDDLYQRFNSVIKKFREIRAEKEAQHQYLRTIVQHVGIGIITFNKSGNIQIMNAAAKSLLGVDKIKNINQLSDVSPELVNSLIDLQTGGRDLMKIDKKGEEVQLAIYAIELIRREEEFKLISIQNIKTELDEKEMDAWQNLIKVLTHEIMNSVTPISSLAATLDSNLSEVIDDDYNVQEMSKEDIEDFQMALQTIHKRSESLIKFVSDFRNLTRSPTPHITTTKIDELVRPIITLLKYDLENHNIAINLDWPENMTIEVDKNQIEQVLINLIKNAIQAFGENFEDTRPKEIMISAGEDTFNRKFLSVADNGSGIEEDALKKVFIPFFTTKKSGSGIGLSLSKQIMRKHSGNITATSTMGEGSQFALYFNK
ncbi:MAG: ATP-binding protein [Reichenbachiella sp.]